MSAFWAWWLAFLRLSAWLGLVPGFVAPVPLRVRLLLAATVAFLVAPALGTVPDPTRMDWISLVALAVQETVTGVVLGLVVRAAFSAVAIAGHLVSSEASLNLNAILLPGSAESSDLAGNLLYMLMVLLMFTLGLHLRLLEVVAGSFQLVPAGGLHGDSALADYFVGLLGGGMALGIQIAAPIVAAGFLLNTLLLVLARALPQLNVFAESFAFRSILMLVILSGTLQLTSEHLGRRLGAVPAEMIHAARLLSAGAARPVR